MFWFDTNLGPRLSTTPEGFLLAKSVPIARTGTQLYRDVEIPQLNADANGWIEIERDAAEVFHPVSVASFAGKPVCDDHPNEMVMPHNWSQLAIGTVASPRRGTGEESNLLLADLLFTTERGINLIRSGRRQLSVGYDAGYQSLGRGRGRQYNIRCNHVAVVDAGRCGAVCSVRDHATGGGTTVNTKDNEVGAVLQVSDPNGRPGPEKVMRLAPFSQYGLLSDIGSNAGWLVRHAGIWESAGTFGGAVRDADYYRGLARQVTVERQRAGAQLKAWNASNRRAWEEKH